MLASLNLKPCAVPAEAGTLADVLRHIEDTALPAGHVITRIVLDGEELADEGELEVMTRPASEVAVVECFSSRTLDLAAESLEAATELLNELGEQLQSTAQSLRQGDLETGLASYSECIEVLDWYVNVVTACDILLSQGAMQSAYDEGAATEPDQLTPGDADGLDLSGPELSTFASVSNLRERLLELEAAQLRGDPRELADELEHEILPIVRLWAREAPLLLARLRVEAAQA